MKLNAEGLHRHLQQTIAPVYLIEGNEPLLVQEALDQLHTALKAQGFLERLSFQVDAGFEVADLNHLTQNLSLFAEKKYVELNCGEKIPAELNQWMIEYCTQTQGLSDLCLIIKTAKLSAAEKKSKWVTAIDKAGIWLTLYDIALAEFPRWLDGRLFQAKLKLAPDARAALIEQTEGNLLAAAQIIQKLAVFNQNQLISFAELNPLLMEGARYDLFDLTRSVLFGDLQRSLKILQYLQHESESVLVLWALSKELKNLYILQTKKNTTPMPALYRSLNIWDKRQREMEAALKRLSAAYIADLLSQCTQIDLAIKGLAEADPWHLLKQLIVKMNAVNERRY